jgi:uncharacterized protein
VQTPVLVPIRRRPRDRDAARSFIEERIEGAGDVFLVPFLDGYLFFSPLTNVSMILDDFGACAVRKHFRNEALVPAEQRLVDSLAARGTLRVPERRVESGSRRRWAPTSATFSNTQKCTLRCTYCYAEGGRLEDLELPWPVAKSALDLIVHNAVEQGESPSISFLGEGEATASWGLFCAIIDYFSDLCGHHGYAPQVSLSTNGVFAESRLDYIAKHCTHVTFSLDGVRAVHDRNRVLPNGRGSFDRVVASMQGLELRGRTYDIRSTVTAAGSAAMTEFVTFVGRRLTCKSVHFEPIFDTTGLTSIHAPIEHVEARSFVEGFRRARQVAAGYGIELYYSGASTRSRETFCGASNASTFLVTSRGLVTSCNEVLQPWDPRAGLFHYGTWNPESAAFVVDEHAIDRLGKLNVHDMPKCQGCIAKYNCAGDCYAKTATVSPTGDPAAAGYTDRCYITRELLKDNLLMGLISQAVGACGPDAAPPTC